MGGAEFYVPTVFDRGHMVRRLDPVWGTPAQFYKVVVVIDDAKGQLSVTAF